MKVQLDDICQRIYAGGDVPKDRFSSVMTNNFTVPIFANAEKDNGLYGYTDIAREYDPCVTVAARGTIGFAAIRDEPFLPVVRLITVVPDRSIVTLKFLYYALKSYKPKSSGTSIPQLTVPELKKHSITLYSIEKQNRITQILDSVSQIIVDRHKELDALDDLIKARFVEMFGEGYPEATILDLCNIIDYRGKTPEKVVDGLPFITAKNVKMHYMSIEPREFISKETYDQVMVRGFPQEGDVVFTTEAPLGNVCRIPHFDTEFYVGQRIVTLQTEKLVPTYLEYALDTNTFKSKLAEKSSGSTVTGIRVRLLEQLTIPVPPRVKQEQFADFVAQIDKSKSVIQKSLDETQLLFDSLMQKYFE